MPMEPLTQERLEALIKETVDRSVYLYTPNGKYIYVPLSEIGNSKYFKHCDITYDSNYPTEFFAALRSSDSSEVEFRFAAGSVSELGKVQLAKQKAMQAEQTVERYRAVCESAISQFEAARLEYVRKAKERRAGKSSRYDKEVIRERLLSSPEVLDVRFDTDPPIDYSKMWVGGSIANTMIGNGNTVYSVPAGLMMVTFVGACYHHPSGLLPTPPLQVTFDSAGNVRGGPLLIHPHISLSTSVCAGEALEMLTAARQNMDIYMAVDAMRVFRLGWDKASQYHSNWGGEAWLWWIDRLNIGWPESEPFQKPWISQGFPVQHNAGKGDIVSLFEILGTDDPELMLKAMHIGLDKTFYSRAAQGPLLKDGVFYKPVGSEPAVPKLCSCGGVPELEKPTLTNDGETPFGCNCHHPSTRGSRSGALTPHPCPSCDKNPGYCMCPWVVTSDWRSISPDIGYRCERRPASGQRSCGGTATSKLEPLWGVSESGERLKQQQVFRYYRGPWYVCPKHVPMGNEDVVMVMTSEGLRPREEVTAN